jgi:hypothetical protein
MNIIEVVENVENARHKAPGVVKATILNCGIDEQTYQLEYKKGCKMKSINHKNRRQINDNRKNL